MNAIQSAVAAAHGWRPMERTIKPCVVAECHALPGTRIAVYSDMASIEPAWRAFERHASCTVFQTVGYLGAWQRHIGNRELVTPAVVVAERAGEPVAIFPLAVRGRGPLRRLTWLGQNLCDYLAPLISPAFVQLAPGVLIQLWREVLALLQSDSRFRHEWIELRKMPASVGTARNPLAALPAIRHPSPGHVATLAGDWESFYRTRRSAKARKQDRSKLARLSELGEVRLFEPHTDADIAATIEALFAQKTGTMRRKGIPDMFERPGYREFFLDLAQNPRFREVVHISALAVGSKLAAINLGMEYKGRYSLFLVSYDGNLSQLSPGVIHLNRLIQRAIGRKLEEFDFLVGEQRLKLEWSDKTIELFDHIAAATVWGIIPAFLARSFTRAKRFVKQTPMLWSTFQRARGFAGSLRGHR